MPDTTFNPNDLPDLQDKVFIVTGGNSGMYVSHTLLVNDLFS